MANINSIITYNANLSPAQAQIKALTGQVAGLTTAFNALDRSALKAQRSVAETFAGNVGQIGGFTAQTVKATSAVESFGKQLAANRLTMREYFREAITGYTRQSSLMRQLAEQQVRYQQSVAVPIGGGQAMMLTPQSINAASSAAQLASARFSIFNELVNGGATSMLNWGKNTQWAGRQLMVGFTLPLALFAGVMSKQFRELDKELTRFQKVYGSDLGNAVSESTQRMRDQVQQLAYDISSAYGIAAKETAALAADIAATGAEGEQLMASVQQTTRLAVLGEVDRQEAMKATLSLQSAFRLNTNELAESINFLNAVENQTSATLEDLSIAIPKVGPVIRSLGGDVKDLATLLVAMREGGIPAAEAANALKSGLASLINPTKQASLVAKQFGVDLVGIVESNRGQLMPTIFAMQDALNGLDSFSRSRIIEQIFGKYQFARISALFDNIGRTGSQTQQVIELATRSSAELAAVANGEIRTLTESVAVKFQRTLENLKNALMPIGQTLTETLIPVLETVGKGIEMFSTFFSSLPESVRGLAKWGVALTALAGPVIMLVGLFGNLVANGLKFGMMIVRLGARMSGIKTEKFQLLDENLMAATLGVDNLTSAFTTQEVAMRRLVGALTAYEQSLGRLAIREPGLFVPGAVPVTRTAPPIRRQKGSTAPEKVPGGYGGGDRIPALLEPGESVITKEATAKFWPVIEAMNRGNLPGFNRGTIFLGMPRGYKDIQGAKQVKQTLSSTNIEATTGRFATLPVTDIGKKVTSIGGRSSSIPGMNGVYEEGGKKYVVKTHDTADSALAEVRGTQLTRDVFGLDTPVQELIKIKHPVTGDVIFAVRSPYEAKFASSTGVIDEKNFFGQALAAIVRRDKDLQPDNLYGNIVTDVGQAFVANKASQPRIIGGELPGVAEQTATNFLMSKGGAKKWFAETTAPLARTMSEDDYVRGFQTTIAEAARKARGAIDNLPYMTKEERGMYSRIIDDLDEAAKIDWRAVYQSHRGITPEVKKPPTAAALAKKEALEAEKARQRGDMARWEYGLPYRFQKGGKVPGGYGGGDKVPAYLEPGEFVITKEATKLNKSFLEAINSGKTPGMYKTGKDSAAGSGQGSVGRAAKLHTVPPDELAKMYYGPGSKSMLGVLGYGGLTTTLHPQYINNTFDKLTGIPSWMKAGIPFNDRAAAQMLSVLIKERDLRGGKVGPEFTKSIQYLQKLIKTPGKARSITLNGYAATTAAAERLAGIIPDTDKAQKARAQQLAAELNKRVGTTTSPGRIFSAINRLSMEYIDKALADPNRRNLIWESTPGTSKTKFKDSLRERLPRFAQSGFLFRGIRMGRFQKGGVGTGEPALLEPGEFVVNSDASAQYAPILRAMNRGTIGRYQDGKDDVTMRPGYNPNDPKYSSPDKTPTGGRHQGHIFGAPVAPGIPAFGKNLQIGGQAIFWHQDFWKMVTAAENQLANVLAMSAGNRARFMESLSTVGPQFNASQQQIDRIMLAVTNGFMQHEDDVTLYQAALRNLGQRISTGAASVTGSMAGLIKQVESIKITGYSSAEAQAVERRLIAEYQRILSTPGQLAETARIAIAKQLQIVQQQMTATGIATTQMTASLASNIKASAGRPFPGGSFVPGKAAAQGPQLAGAEQGLTRALQLRERLQLRLVASSERLEKLDAAAARIKADTSLSEQKRKAALDNLTKQYYEELNNNEILNNASNRAEQNLIRAKERAAISYATVQPGGTGGRSGGGDTTFLGMPAIPPRSGATGPDTAMKDPMARMMRGQGLMNVAFMGSMAIGSLGALGVASEDAASKLMLLSTALMALPMLGMMNPKGMATNFMGLTSAGKGLTGLGSRVAGPASAGMATSAVKGTSAVLPTFSAARGVGGLGGGLMMAGRGLSFLGGPIGIAAGLGITAAITGFMMYRNAAEKARERAIAAFNDPVKSAEYFGETIMNVSDILEKNRLSNISEDLGDVDKALREAVKQDYAPLIEQIKYLSAGAGAQALSVAYSNMIISGMSAENAKAAIEAIASEAGAVGGKAFTEALAQGFFKESLTIEQAVQNIVNQFTPAETKYGKTQQTIEERIRSDIAALEEEAQRLRADTAVEYTGQAPSGPPYAPIEPGGKEDYKRVEDQNSRLKVRNDRLKEITDTINQLEDRLQDLLTINSEQISGIMDSLIMAYQQDPSAAIDGIKDLIDNINSLEDEGDRIDALNRVTDYLRDGYGQEWNLVGDSIDTANEKLIAAQMLAAGISLEKAVDSAYRFDAALGQAVLTAKVLADEAGRAAIELQTSLTEDIVGDIEAERRSVETEIQNIEDANDKLIRGYNRRRREKQEEFEQDQENSQNAIEGMQDEMDARRELFDEEMEQLDDRRDAIEKSSEAYIKSLQKNNEAESFYSQQRKTSLSALEKLASGDVFGFLQEREQMSQDAQDFSYDQMISGIEDRRDLELEAIDEVRKKKQDEQEEYENMMQDRIEAEQELMEQQQEAHDAQMQHYDKQIKKAEREKDRKISVKQEEIEELNTMQETASKDILEFQRVYAEEYEKYDPYARQLENLKILRVQEIYFRGGSSLFAAAQKAGIPTQDVADFIEKNASEFAFTLPGALSGVSVTPTAGTYYKNWMTEKAPDTQDLSQTIKDMTVSGDIIVNGNILGGSGTGPESWGPPNRRGTTRDYEGTTYEYNWESDEWVPQAATGGYIKNGRVNLQDGGGAVRGPGGPKSDVIPAMLSNGEYVIQASSVRKYGADLMHTINSGKYATGGFVTADRAEQNATGTRGRPKPQYSGGTPTYSGGYSSANAQAYSKPNLTKPKNFSAPSFKQEISSIVNSLRMGAATVLDSFWAPFRVPMEMFGVNTPDTTALGRTVGGSQYNNSDATTRALLAMGILPFGKGSAAPRQELLPFTDAAGMPYRPSLNISPIQKGPAPGTVISIGRGIRGARGIAESGKFKNMFETNTTTGSTGFEDRAAIERRGWGIPFNADPSARPIYGLLRKEDEVTFPYGEFLFDIRYDPTRRTSYSPGDTKWFSPPKEGLPDLKQSHTPGKGNMDYAEVWQDNVKLSDVSRAHVAITDTMDDVQVQEILSVAQMLRDKGVPVSIHGMETNLPWGQWVHRRRGQMFLPGMDKINQYGESLMANGGLVQKFADGGLVESMEKYFPNGGHQFYPGWNRFNSWAGGKPGLVMMHHTAGNWGQGELDYFAKNWVGKPVVQGFIRKTGTAHTLAGGNTGYGAGTGSVERLKDVGAEQAAELISLGGGPTSTAWQIEVQSLGDTKDFTSGQFDSIARMTAAIRDWAGWPSFKGRIINHRDWTARKPDTLYDRSVFQDNAQKIWEQGGGVTVPGGGTENKDRPNRGANATGAGGRYMPISSGGGIVSGPIGDKKQSIGKAAASILSRAILPKKQKKPPPPPPGTTTTPGTTPTTTPGTTPGGSSLGSAAVRYATSQLGKPYSLNAIPPNSWDCSTLTAWAWAVATGADPSRGYYDSNAKVRLTPYSHTQANQISKRVVGNGGPISGLVPGDILYFRGTGSQSGGHTSIYTGNGKVFEASSPSIGLRYSDLNNSWNQTYFAWAGPPQGYASGGLVQGYGSNVKKMKMGGAVFGGGSPTSDNIPAMLSNGEYVVKASSVRKYGKNFLDKLNSGQLSIPKNSSSTKFNLPSPSSTSFISNIGNNGSLNRDISTPSYSMPTNPGPSSSILNSGGSSGGGIGSRNTSVKNSNNIKIIVNGSGRNAGSVANQVVEMLNSQINRRDHSRSSG